MYFITNKTVKPSKHLFEVVANSNELSQSLRYCKMVDDILFKEVYSKTFMESLRDADEKELLFYIHGFHDQPYENVFPRTKQIQKQLNDGGLNDIIVVPIIWPCDKNFDIIKDYWDDQESAEHSGAFFNRLISKLLAWQNKNALPCLKRMHVLAHSMGAMVLMRCLSYWADKFGHGGVPHLFKNIFLLASDIPNNSLEKNQAGSYIVQSAQRIICYYAHDDLALTGSKIANIKNAEFTRRLGYSGPEDMSKVSNDVYAVDCDSFNNKFDTLGHTYFLDKDGKTSPAFQHIIKVLKTKVASLGDREIVL